MTSFRTAVEAHSYAPSVEFRVLGPIEVVENGNRVGLGGPKQRTVLALLVADAGRPVAAGALMTGVYGDDAPPSVRRSLQTYISNLRSELGDIIRFSGDSYTLTVERDQIDALVFEDSVRSSVAANIRPEDAAAALRDALSLWRGHPFADVEAHGRLRPEITRLNELRMEALAARVDADLAAGHHRGIIAELESLTVEYPTREEFRAQQMLALYRSGRQADALRAYERARTYLVEELGLDPSPELRHLEQQILDHDESLAFSERPAIRRATVMAADIGDPDAFAMMGATERTSALRLQTDILDDAVSTSGGSVFAHRGSALYASFADVSAAARAAGEAQRALTAAGSGLEVRIAIDSGDVEHAADGGVTGPPVGRSAALVAAAHPGQILLTGVSHDGLTGDGGAGWMVLGLGTHDFPGIDAPVAVHQLVVDGRPKSYPPLRTNVLPPPLPVSATGLPGYELRDEVGSGAFGVVHRGYQPSVGREVAVKIIRPEFANSPEFIRRFEVEAQLVARLEHPHIVPLHDYWRSPLGGFLVMRWLRGGSLQDRLASGPLTHDEVSALIAQIGSALTHAHRHGVVHRDIKPSNVLFDEEGNAYLTDFGIAAAGAAGAGVIEDCRALMRLANTAVGDIVVEPDATYPDVASVVSAWQEATGGDTGTSMLTLTPTRNPYKGLRAFGELDAADFHGRSVEVEALVDALASHRLVAVVGPSGIGKSSVVRAGLIPALRRGAIEGSERWLVTDMLPGGFPFDELASALLRVAVEAPADLDEQLRRDERGLVRVAKRLLPPGSQLLLIVDQFEELFTLTASDEHRSAFLSMLAATVADERSHIRIVVTMRADYFDRPLRFAELGDALRAGTVPIPAPTEPELSAMVEEPARGVGVSFESGLVERIVADVKGQPGALPLLEFAMTELFDARQSDVLQGHAYGTSGGVLGALGRRAESIHLELDEEGRTVARQMFLRLVNVVESGRDTRRRVRIVELRRLGFPEELLDSVLESFGEHRLLTFDQDPVTRGPTVEVAHEALFAEWDRLNTWISEQREDLLLRSRLAEALAEWESAERAESYLLTGGRLTQHEAWTSATELSLTTAEREFLAQSRMREDQLSTQRRRVRRLVMSGFGVAALVALLLAVVAVAARDDAREQAALAYGRELAASAIGVVDDDPELATLLAIEAFDVAPEGTELFPEAMIALRQAMDTNRLVARVQTTRGVGVAFSADDALLVVDSGERSVSRYEIESGRIAPDPVWVYQDLATIDFFEDVVVHPRGDFAAVVITDRDFGGEPGNGVDLDSERSDGKMGRVVLIDPATGAFLGEVPMAVCEQAEFGPWWFSSDGSLFGIGLVGFDQTADGCGPQIVRGAFTIFHTETWTEIARFADARVTMTNDMSRVLVDELEFASDARTVASLLSWPSLDPVDTFDIAGDVSIAPDGRTLVYRLPNEIETRPGFWDVETNRHLAWGDGAGGFSGSMGPFTPDGAVLIASTKDDTLYDPRTGLAWLTLPTSFTTGLALSIDGRYAATAGPAGVELWDLSYRSDATSLTDSPAGIAWINSDAFEEGPRTVLRGFWCTALRTPEGCEPLQPRVVVIDPDTGRVIAHRDARLNSSQLPDGRIVIVPVTGNDIHTYRDDILGPPTIWDPASGDEVTLQDCHAPLAEYFSHTDEGGLGERGYTCPGGDFFFGHSVVASADGRFVAALGHDPSTAPPPDPNTPVSHTEVLLRVWDTTTLQALATHKVALDCCLGNHTITYLGDGWVTLIDGEAGSSSQSVVYKIIGVETGDVIARLQTEASWRESIAVSTEETMLYLVDEGGDVFEFDTETWTQVRRWPAMEGRPRGLSLSRDDRFLAVGGEDGLISIWDLSSEEPVLVDRIPIGGWVSDTVWLEDGRLGVAVKPPGLRAEWWVVDVAPAAVLARARDASLRDFTPTECRTYNIERCAKG